MEERYLTYASYLCIPRSVLQLMPVQWQREFVALMEKLPSLPETEKYECRRRDARGRYIYDPYHDYRHPSERLQVEIEKAIVQKQFLSPNQVRALENMNPDAEVTK